MEEEKQRETGSLVIFCITHHFPSFCADFMKN